MGKNFLGKDTFRNGEKLFHVEQLGTNHKPPQRKNLWETRKETESGQMFHVEQSGKTLNPFIKTLDPS